MGVYNSFSQPAYLVYSPYKFDANIIGAKASLFNKSFMPGSSTGIEGVLSNGGKIGDIFALREQSVLVNANVVLPSFMYAINDKNAISISSRVRAIGYAFSTDFNVLKFFMGGLPDGNINSEGDVIAGFALAWSEFNLGYSRVIYERNRHSFSAGLNAKLLLGAASVYFGVDNLTFETRGSVVENLEGDLSFYYNDQVDELAGGKDVKIFSNPGLGVDVGIAYKLENKDPSKGLSHKLKVGVSMLDFGAVKFSSSENSLQGSVDGANQEIKDYAIVESPEELSKQITDDFNVTNDVEPTYTVNLPMKITLNIDYNIWYNFYLGTNVSMSSINFVKQSNLKARNDSYAGTLRYETKYIGLSIPYSYNQILKSQLGVSARLGPLVFGSSNIFTTLIKDTDFGFLNLFVAGRFTILKKKNK